MKGGAQLYSRLVPLFEYATAGDGPPTDGQRQVHGVLKTELDGLAVEYRRLVEADLPALNAEASKLNLGFITVPKP